MLSGTQEPDSDVTRRGAQLPEPASISSGSASTGSGLWANTARPARWEPAPRGLSAQAPWPSPTALRAEGPGFARPAGGLGGPRTTTRPLRPRTTARRKWRSRRPLTRTAADGAAVTRAPEGGAEDAGAGPQASDGGTDGHDPRLSPRGPGRQGNCSRHDGEGGPGSKGAVVEGACAPPLAERAPRALAPGGDAAPAAVTSSRLLELLTVSFRSPLEAEMARRSLTTHVQRHRGLAQKELCVRGSALAVRWTAEDPIFFRVSVNSFLDRLPLVIRNIRALGSRPPRRLGPGKGAEA
ncbi:translation initiation factor IF-2-like [Panthera pardus]|uniref:L antigen family member 3 n=1 Tax=Panthera pardus TaxID=9691 RepID=A0A9W2UTE3_PANPR|nr:translation initiation factor IF-2-like [Panthera pardus]